jgi:O-antigen ligase
MNAETLAAPRVKGHKLEAAAIAMLLGFVAALQVSIAAAGILLTALLVFWVAFIAKHHERVEVPSMFWPLAAYAGATLVSAAFSSDPTTSVIDCKQLVVFLIVPAVYRLARGRRANTLTNVIITVGALTAIVGVVQYGILHYDNLGRRPQGTLTHYMTYSGVVMLVTGLAAARLLFRKEERTWPALVMPALLAALALTFTRSAWVGAAMGIGVLLLLKDRRLIAILPLGVAAFIAFAPAPVTTRLWSMFDPNDPTSRDRVAMLRSGVHMVHDHPLTGLGPNMIKEHYEQYRDPTAVEKLNVHLHNVPMQIAAERGLPALAIWLWFIVVLVRDMCRRLQSPAIAHLAAAAIAAVVSMLGAGLFEYNFGDSEFLMLFLVLVTLPYAAERPDEDAR